MRAAIFILCSCGVLIGCAMVPAGFHAIWLERTPPPGDLPVPAGFKITAAEAYTNLYRVDRFYADTPKAAFMRS